MTKFIRNDYYIDLLIKHSELSKVDIRSMEYRRLQKELLQIEKAMPSTDIIQNTKIAFPSPIVQ